NVSGTLNVTVYVLKPGEVAPGLALQTSEPVALGDEQAKLETLMGSVETQWATIAEQIRELRDLYSPKSEEGRRRTTFAEAPDLDVDLATAFIQEEPITVVLSQKGWIRAMKGKLDDLDTLKFKEGDGLAFAVPAKTTDKIILFASNGKAYTLAGDKLPGGRGNGEPIRLMIDLENDHLPVGLFVHDPERTLLVASSEGYGFRVREADVIASTKGGKQVQTVKGSTETQRVVECRGDRIAIIGENRKLLVFPMDEVSELTRGKGVRLQKYRDGGMSDVATFASEDGLSYIDSAGRRQEVPDWPLYEGSRAQVGRNAPRGFSRQALFVPDKRL
ncbi:MAG: DNA gyrase C-terminal beta-propeller domain-containing protein, partial [Pseudomonadota bacterium]